ncbi:MAG: DMT family transporter [Methanocella sp.]
MESGRAGLTHLALAITVTTWASAFVGIRVGLQAFSPYHVALLRYLVASVTLAVYAAVARLAPPDRRDLPVIALSGLVGIALYNVLLGYGEVALPAATASFIIASAPVWMALCGVVALKERIRPAGWVGLAVSFAGVAAIALGKGQGLSINGRALVVLAAAVAQSLYSLIQKPLLRRYRPLQIATYAIWSGTLALLPFAGGLVRAVAAAPVGSTLAVVYLGIVPGALGYVMWAQALASVPASTAGSYLYLVPPLALGLGWAWLGEVPSLVSLLGGALVVAGVMVVNRRSGAAAQSVERTTPQAGGTLPQ